MASYKIPITLRDEVEKKVASFQKKADKYGCKFSVTFGENSMEECHLRDENGAIRSTFSVECFAIDLGVESIRCGSFHVLAKIEHMGDKGNVVFPLTEYVNPAWRFLPASCDHCHTNRSRSVTFIVSDGAIEKNVGKSCLKDYTGIDPDWVLSLMALRDEFLHDDISMQDDETCLRGACVYSVSDALGAAAKLIKLQGYVKADEPCGNKHMIARELDCDNLEEEYKAAGKALLEYVLSIPDDDLAGDSLLSSVKTLCKAGYCKEKQHFGLIAYAPLACTKHELKKAEEAKRKAAESSSEYIGAIGSRITIDVQEIQYVTSWQNAYGITHLYKMVDTSGNILVWFASSPLDYTQGPHTIKATVKDHSERDGVKQTIITRCAIIK